MSVLVLALLSAVAFPAYLAWEQRSRISLLNEQNLSYQADLAQLRARHYQALLEQGHQDLPDPRTALDDFGKAITFADSVHINSENARQARSALPTVTSLGNDCTIQIVQAKHSSPATLIDVAVLRGGQLVPGLRRVDFELTNGDRRMRFLDVEPIEMKRSEMSVAVVFDCSSSTDGEPFRQSQQAGLAFCDALAPFGQIRLWSFADNVQALTPWTSDPRVLNDAIKKMRSSGATQLLSAVRQAITDLARRSGERTIVLFTDGRDSTNAPNPATVIELSQQNAVNVHCVALKSKDVDEAFLKQLAQESGGSYTSATQPEQLVQSFLAIATSLRQLAYRIVSIDRIDPALPITLRIANLPGERITLKHN